MTTSSVVEVEPGVQRRSAFAVAEEDSGVGPFDLQRAVVALDSAGPDESLPLSTLDGSDPVFGPTGHLLATATNQTTTNQFATEPWDITDPRRPRPLAMLQGTTHPTMFSSNGLILDTDSADSGEQLWDIGDPGIRTHSRTWIRATVPRLSGGALGSGRHMPQPSRPFPRLTGRDVTCLFPQITSRWTSASRCATCRTTPAIATRAPHPGWSGWLRRLHGGHLSGLTTDGDEAVTCTAHGQLNSSHPVEIAEGRAGRA
jgi:hypothetical protein